MLNLINKAVNFLYLLDPQVNSLLFPLNNKSLTINIDDIDFIVTFEVKNSKIYVTNEYSKNILKGKLAYILELMFNKNLQELIIAKKLDYQGSLKDLNDFNKFFNAIDIDLIYRVSEITSPEFAGIVAKPFQKIKDFLKTSQQETIVDIKDFLTEEKRVLVSQNEMNVFYHQVQELKQAIDRIEAKLKLLKA
ncbi:MAG: hypothetical protein Kow0076_5740 [Francisella sp.]